MRQIPLALFLFAFLSLTCMLILAPVESLAAQPADTFWNKEAAEAEALLASDPDNVAYVFRIAVVYANLGKIDESADAFVRAGSLDKEKTYANKLIETYQPLFKTESLGLRELNYLAFAYYSEEQYPIACQIFYKVVEKDPTNEWPLDYLGFSLYKAGRLDEAVSVLQRAVRLDPKNEYSHFLLGMAYYYTGRYIQALGEISHASGVVRKYLKNDFAPGH